MMQYAGPDRRAPVPMAQPSPVIIQQPSQLASPLITQVPTMARGAAPTLSGQIGGGLMAGAGTMAMGAAAGPEIPIIAFALGAVVEWVKNLPWFREATWTFPLTVLLSFAVAAGIWGLLAHDGYQAIIRGFGILGNMHLNYQGLKATGLGIFQPTDILNKFESMGASIPTLPTSDQIGMKLAETITPGIVDMNRTLDQVNAGQFPTGGKG